ncbi:MAG: sigma-70 family RNA polymerase sigma factor [Flavobacterium sp.]|nr:sigma-70 family RNA polymerase sigma factor [Flavobacterium sp.]
MLQFYKNHKKWINVVRNFGEDFFAEDIVMEAYLYIDKKENVNDNYFWSLLRSLTVNLQRQKKKHQLNELTDNLTIFDEVYSETQCKGYILEFIDTWYWYDKKLYLLVKSGYSMRKIARETGIGFNSIYNTVKNCEQKIKDYEKIT